MCLRNTWCAETETGIGLRKTAKEHNPSISNSLDSMAIEFSCSTQHVVDSLNWRGRAVCNRACGSR